MVNTSQVNVQNTKSVQIVQLQLVEKLKDPLGVQLKDKI